MNLINQTNLVADLLDSLAFEEPTFLDGRDVVEGDVFYLAMHDKSYRWELAVTDADTAPQGADMVFKFGGCVWYGTRLTRIPAEELTEYEASMRQLVEVRRLELPHFDKAVRDDPEYRAA